MKGIKAEFRSEMVTKTLGDRSKFTENHQRESFSHKWLQGWLTAMPPVGPAYEKVALVHETHPLVPIIKFAEAGKRTFGLAELERALENHPFSPDGHAVLSKSGLAITGFEDQSAILTPADPRAARYVNMSRFGLSSRGFQDRNVIEAFLANRDPHRRWIRVRDEVRMRTVEVLNSRWEIECDDLLNCQRFVKLASRWILVPPRGLSDEWRVILQPKAA